MNKKQLINLGKARKLALAANKRKQEEFVEELKNKNIHLRSTLNKNIEKMLLAVLYLGEGSKYPSSRYLGLGNANPEVIQLYLKLLKDCYNIDETKIKIAVQCRSDQNITELEKYWQTITSLPKENFYKARVDKRSIGKKTKKPDYKGVCVVMYFNTSIQRELGELAKQLNNWLQ